MTMTATTIRTARLYGRHPNGTLHCLTRRLADSERRALIAQWTRIMRPLGWALWLAGTAPAHRSDHA